MLHCYNDGRWCRARLRAPLPRARSAYPRFHYPPAEPVVCAARMYAYAYHLRSLILGTFATRLHRAMPVCLQLPLLSKVPPRTGLLTVDLPRSTLPPFHLIQTMSVLTGHAHRAVGCLLLPRTAPFILMPTFLRCTRTFPSSCIAGSPTGLHNLFNVVPAVNFSISVACRCHTIHTGYLPWRIRLPGVHYRCVVPPTAFTTRLTGNR